VISNKIHLYMMLNTNLLILFYVWIKVRRIKRSQFDAVWMMLERCVIMKAVMQSFYLRDNILSNSHNWSTKKTNDMSKSVRDEKILLVEKSIQMMSLRLWLQVIEELMTRWLRWYTETSSSHRQCRWVIDEKISDRIVNSDEKSWVDTTCDRRSSDSSIMLIYWRDLSSSSLLNVKSCIYLREKSRAHENDQNAFSTIDQS